MPVQRHTEFHEMLNKCEGTLVKVCLYFTNNRDDFLDLYQEIVCTLWESWDSFRGESDTNTWATRVALNVAKQNVRKRKRLPQFILLDESHCDLLVDEATDLRYQQLYSLIDQLNEDDRELLFLYLDRKRMQQIAAITGSTETAVKQKIYRIKIKLLQLKQKAHED